MNLNSEEQNEILESWSRAAADHANRIRAKNAAIAAHVDNQTTFSEQMATNNPFTKTTDDIAETVTGCFVDNLNN